MVVVDEGVGLVVQVVELGVTVGVLASLGHLGVGLERVAESVQQAQHRARGDLETLAHQLVGQLGGGLRRPAQLRHRVAPGLGVDELVEGAEQTGLGVEQRLVATTRGAQPHRWLDARRDFSLGLDHRVAAHPRRDRHRRLATTPEHLRRRTGDDPALHLVHVGQDHFEESREPFLGDLHTARLLRAINQAWTLSL